MADTKMDIDPSGDTHRTGSSAFAPDPFLPGTLCAQTGRFFLFHSLYFRRRLIFAAFRGMMDAAILPRWKGKMQ